MTKVVLERNAFLVPVPVVILSCVGREGAPNLLAVSWVSVACAVPPIVSVAVREERYSYRLLRESGEFVLNIPSAALVRAVDLCGTTSGEDVDKFALTGLTPVPSLKVRPPLVEECPINMECVVRQTLPLGSHVLFLAEVVALHADEAVVEEGAVVTGRVAPLVYDPYGGNYWNLREVVAHHGFSEGTMPEPPDVKRTQSQKRS